MTFNFHDGEAIHMLPQNWGHGLLFDEKNLISMTGLIRFNTIFNHLVVAYFLGAPCIQKASTIRSLHA